MTNPRTILAALLSALTVFAAPTPAAFAQDDDNGTKWLQERREERLKDLREQRREEGKRDPLVTPGTTRSYTPKNPVAPRSRSLAPGTLPWNSN